MWDFGPNRVTEPLDRYIVIYTTIVALGFLIACIIGIVLYQATHHPAWNTTIALGYFGSITCAIVAIVYYLMTKPRLRVKPADHEEFEARKRRLRKRN